MQVPAQQDFFSVYMSAVEHVGHFWVQVLGERAGSLDLLIQSMTQYYSQPGNLQVCGCFVYMKCFLKCDGLGDFGTMRAVDTPGPSFTELLEQEILLIKFLLSKSEQDTNHKWYV